MTAEPADRDTAPGSTNRQDALTARLNCYYADGTQLPPRPHCEHVAVIAYGPIALCAQCNLMRSAVGKGIAPRTLPDAELHRLIAAARTLDQANTELVHALRDARRAGASWAHIGDAVGVTRQAAQQHWTTPS